MAFDLNKKDYFSLLYHDIFDYPLNQDDLKRWTPAHKFTLKKLPGIDYKKGFYFLKGRERLILVRKNREGIYPTKLQIAQRAAQILEIIPTVHGVFLTGACAMRNADKDSDIDFMVITSKNCLWTTRILSYLLFYIAKVEFRRFHDKNEKDKICLNIWLDEADLSWNKAERNIYTAHEIAQVVPMVNKGKIYEKFLWENRWIRDYWPKAVIVHRTKPSDFLCTLCSALCAIFEPLARALQFWYMRGKITKELVTSDKALFHPNNISDRVLSHLNKYAATKI